MRRFIRKSGFVLFAFALATGPVYAQSQQRHGSIEFETLDRDGDGQITRDEMTARRADRFRKADVNGDGLLSLQEMQEQAVARAQERAEKMFSRLDSDGDGFISGDEIEPGPGASRRFDRFDSDGDGSINKEEFEAARTRMRERHGKLE